MGLGIVKFSHVVMPVSDRARSVAFDHDPLGLPKRFERSFTAPRSGRTIELAQFADGLSSSAEYAQRG